MFPDVALLARERGARSSRERPAVTLLSHSRVGGRRLNADTPATMGISPSLCPGCGKSGKSLSALHLIGIEFIVIFLLIRFPILSVTLFSQGLGKSRLRDP